MARVSVSSTAPTSVRADVVAFGVWHGASGPVPAVEAAALDEALGGRLAATLSGLGCTGDKGQVTRFATLGATTAPTVLAIGLGAGPADEAGPDPESVRRAAGAAVRAAAGSRRVALALPADSPELLRAVCEGARLGSYSFERYRSKDGRPAPVSEVTVLSARSRARDVLRRAETVTDAVGLVRDLVNTPPSDLHPAEFAGAVVAVAEDAGLAVDVLDERALRRGGYGGILGVGAGSAHPPRMVHMRYAPAAATTTLALVGKGITFDSGGLSLKPAASMEDMKSDMAGAAAVAAATAAIARLELPIRVETWIPMAENMPSGSAIRPSDVLSIHGGKQVEVLNTDAEGRLILADAIVRAGEDSPDYLVDVATLTGAQLVALGSRTAAVMGNDDAFRDRLLAAAGTAGEAFWPMPLPAELRPSLDSAVADIANMGERQGGMLVAGLFLQDFVADGIAWAHLDIAGPAFNTGEPYGYTPRGGTGMAVRTLVQLAADLAAG